MVAFDASILIHVLSPDARSSVPDASRRVLHLVNQLSDEKQTVLVPTPALSECLVHAGPAAPEYLAIMGRSACFRVASFDQRAAVEAAIRTYEARQRGLRKGGDAGQAKAKIKFDRQIVAIAFVEGVSCIYSDDDHVAAYAKEAGLEAIAMKDLPLPDPDQGSLDLAP